MSKPLALDLCCGKGGWTIGLQAAGWDVIGFDITKWSGYPGRLILGDIRDMHIQKHSGQWWMAIKPRDKHDSWLDWPLPQKPSLVTASPPLSGVFI